MLATLVHPATTPDGSAPLVIVHGLYGSARNWNAMARRLATTRDVIAVDQRNHGESAHLPSHSYADMAGDIAEVIEGLGRGEVDILGHSMGGKAAMVLALTRPALLRRVIVADIAPVAYTHDQSQYARAMMGLDLDGLTTRAEADRRLSASVDDPALRAFFLQSLDLKAPGGPRWRLNLPQLEASMSEVVGWPEIHGQFEKPALFLTGGASSYVLPEHRATIRDLFPRARFAKLADAGHWLQADKPREFEETVRVFLDA